jgi:hypothetical protein
MVKKAVEYGAILFYLTFNKAKNIIHITHPNYSLILTSTHYDSVVIFNNYETLFLLFANSRERGATVVDNLEVENLSIVLDPTQSGEMITLLSEFKLSINKYLQELIYSPVRSLAEIIEFNINNPVLVSTIYTFNLIYINFKYFHLCFQILSTLLHIILCIRYLYGIEKLCNINIKKEKIRNYVSFRKHMIRTLNMVFC